MDALTPFETEVLPAAAPSVFCAHQSGQEQQRTCRGGGICAWCCRVTVEEGVVVVHVHGGDAVDEGMVGCWMLAEPEWKVTIDQLQYRA